MFKILKKLLLTILILFIAVIVATGAVGACIWFYPKEAWAFAEAKILPKDLKITWGKLDVDLRHQGGFKFSFAADIEKFHLVKGSPELDIPVEQIQLRLALDPFSDGSILTLQNAKIRAPDPMQFTAGPPQPPTSEESPFEQVHKYINLLRKSSRFKIESFDVEVVQFIFTTYDKKSTRVALRLNRSQRADEDVIDFSSTVLLPNHPPTTVSLAGALYLGRIGHERPFLDAKLQLQGWGVDTEQRLLFQSQNEDTIIRVMGGVFYQKDKIRMSISPNLWARVKPQAAEIVLKANARGVPGPLVKIDNFEARLNIPFAEGQTWSPEASDFSVVVPVDVFFIDAKMKPPLEKACECKIPETLKVEYRGQVWLKDLLGTPKAEKKVLQSRLSVESIKNKLLSVDFAALLDMHKTGEKITYAPKVDAHFVLHSFRGMRNFLDAKNVLIPAPLDILDGQVEFKAQGPLNLNQEVYEFPMTARIWLNSKTQQVHLEADSMVNLKASLEELYLKIKLQIQDLQLELPPLNPVGGIPRIAPDTRILKAPKVAPKSSRRKFKVAFDFEVVTTKPGAIRLLSQYANPYLPLTLAMSASNNKDTQGFLQTEPFKVEYLRRVVQVEKMRMDFENIEKNILPLSGRLRIDQGDYKIFINFEGTVQQPQITMTSDPDLSQNEIISVLLYGRTSDQLVSADAQTAGSFEAAMADRAIGLFGLWAFAATPIRSFSYNPVTKVYTATVMITEDLSAGIGTNWEESARLELRKRVSRRWMLTASWAPNSEGEMEEKLVLQWENRF